MSGAIHSIRESKSIERLSRTFAQNFSAAELAEPLLSLDQIQPASIAAELMRTRNLPVLGVRRDGLVAGWIAQSDLRTGTLAEQMHEFAPDAILDADATCEAVLTRMPQTPHIFIKWLGEISGVITQRDLQKPAARMWLFGAITTLDTNLTWAVRQLHPDGAWQSCISKGRFEKASALHAERTRQGNRCDLVDCLQIKDKTDILLHDRASLDALGIASRKEAERVTRGIEKLRNHLAHAQELEESDLALASRLASLIRVILAAEGAQRLVSMQGSKDAAFTHAPAL